MRHTITLALVAFGCASCATAALPPPCDEATAAKMAAVCAARVQTECVDKGIAENDCPAIFDCELAAEQRQRECLR